MYTHTWTYIYMWGGGGDPSSWRNRNGTKERGYFCGHYVGEVTTYGPHQKELAPAYIASYSIAADTPTGYLFDDTSLILNGLLKTKEYYRKKGGGGRKEVHLSLAN